MEAIPFFVLMYCVFAFALFWIIRLGVRYGVNDALRRNRSWLASSRPDSAASPTRSDVGE
jgi:hypothetical protein